MLRTTLTVHPVSGQTYLPKLLRDNGFQGDVAVLADDTVVVLIKRGAQSARVRQSLKFVIDHVWDGDRENEDVAVPR